jgi:glyoxylase-like metal-dependent hydrolase (beta-lactamase superfamily II)
LKAGRGIVLVDTGMHDRDSMGNLERALDQAGFKVRDIRLIVITHAHIDHCGQAPPLAARSRAEVWMHPNWKLHAAHPPDLDETIEVALLSGVPEEPLKRWAEKRRGQGSGQAGTLYSDRDLLPGVTIETDAGVWQVIETPGHAPSHVCLFQRERRLMISGDHLLGRISLYYDYGYSPDPAGEFLQSLERVEDLAPRLCLPGHGRTFNDVEAHIHANRRLVAERIQRVLDAIEVDPLTVVEIVPHVYGQAVTELTAHWWLSETLCYLQHLEMTGRAVRVDGDGGNADRWSAVGP